MDAHQHFLRQREWIRRNRPNAKLPGEYEAPEAKPERPKPAAAPLPPPVHLPCIHRGDERGWLNCRCKSATQTLFACRHEIASIEHCMCILDVPRSRPKRLINELGTVIEISGELTDFVAICSRCQYRQAEAVSGGR